MVRWLIALAAPLLATGAAATGCSSEPDTASSPADTSPLVVPSTTVPAPTFLTVPAELGSCASTAVAYNEAFNQVSVLVTGATADQFAAAQRTFSDLRSRVPEELVADFGTVHDAVLAFSEKASGLDLTTAEGAQAMSEAGQALNAAAVIDANNRIDAWFRTNCAEPEIP